MNNLNFLFSPNAACCVDAAGVPQCSVNINGSIGDTVFEDLDGDGQPQEAGEPGIPNVEVELQDSGGITLETQSTDGSGNYLFQFLQAGEYSVLVDPATVPDDFDPTFDIDGIVTPHIALLTLLPGESRLDVDFGYSPCDADDDSDSDSDSDSDRDSDSDKPRRRWSRWRWRR